MWISCFTLFLLLPQLSSSHGNRQRRYLLFTPATQYGVFATVSVPLFPMTTTSVAWFYEANYYNVDNATYLHPLLDLPLSRNQGKRSTDVMNDILTRKYLYDFIESMLDIHGYPGRGCLLRAICENHTSHFLQNGLLGDVLHLILTPSASVEENDIEDVYYEAEYNGRDKECDKYYIHCLNSPLDYLTVFVEYLI